MRSAERLAALVVVLVVSVLLAACKRETRSYSNASSGPVDDNAWAMGEGQHLYAQMGCIGCHEHGGGGIGPSLMDGKWRYGADDASMFTTIAGGRPNGMPAFGGRLTDSQIWQLVAYVKSLSGRASPLVAGVRDDHMMVRPGPARTDPEPISQETP
ncbi:MAG: cytochrome [Labilithrix sp.]|nr:cytochrome [Labilithrix sp.]